MTINYPKTAKTFMKWCNSNIKWENIYYKLGAPRPFDVTLRDGFQGLTKEEQHKYTFDKKKELYKEIQLKHNPKNYEVGSLTSTKFLPIFNDSIDLLRYLEKYQDKLMVDINSLISYNTLLSITKPNNFILIPTQENLLKVINYKEFKNYSFITSVSDSFQHKNTRMSLIENDMELLNIMYLVDDHICIKNTNIKLYISCISECPIEGKIDNDLIVNRIFSLYNSLKPDNMCLSDTCGTLSCDDFEYIVDNSNRLGVPFSKMSLHLHVNQNRENEVERIIHKALDRKIVDFDVSMLETGGCSVTMDKYKLLPNLSYELYYKCLVSYITNCDRCDSNKIISDFLCDI